MRYDWLLPLPPLFPRVQEFVSSRAAFVLLCGSVLMAFGCNKGFESDSPGRLEALPSTPADRPAGASLDADDIELPPAAEAPQRTPAEIIAEFKQLAPNQITDSSLAELCALDEAVAAFDALDCSKSRITDAGLNHIAKLTNLVELKIDATQITPAGVQEVASLPQLKTLSMRGVPLPQMRLSHFDAGVAAVAEMEHLTDLDLSGTRVSTAVYADVGKMVRLQRLALNGTNLTDVGIARLSGLIELKVLEVNRTHISDAGIASLKQLTKLHTLLMSETEITGAGFAALSKGMTDNGFRVIDASRTGFGQLGFAGLIGSKSLEVLLVDRAAVTDSSLVGIQGCVNLRELRLSKNSGISDVGIRSLGGLTNLEELTLNDLPRVSDRSLGFFKNHKKLKRLGLNGSSCTLTGIQQLKQLLPKLKVVFQGQEI